MLGVKTNLKEPINTAYLFSRHLQIGFQPELQ